MVCFIIDNSLIIKHQSGNSTVFHLIENFDDSMCKVEIPNLYVLATFDSVWHEDSFIDSSHMDFKNDTLCLFHGYFHDRK